MLGASGRGRKVRFWWRRTAKDAAGAGGFLSVAVVSLVPLVPARDACWSAGYATVSQWPNCWCCKRAEVLVQREEWGSPEMSLPFSRSLAAVSHSVAVLSFRAVVWSQVTVCLRLVPLPPKLA
jgi:hypothetical protein